MVTKNTYCEEKRFKKDQRKKGRFEDQRPEVKKIATCETESGERRVKK